MTLADQPAGCESGALHHSSDLLGYLGFLELILLSSVKFIMWSKEDVVPEVWHGQYRHFQVLLRLSFFHSILVSVAYPSSCSKYDTSNAKLEARILARFV